MAKYACLLAVTLAALLTHLASPRARADDAPAQAAPAYSKLALLRSCTRCHGPLGLRRPLTWPDGTSRLTDGQMRRNANLSLTPGSPYAPQDERGYSELRLLLQLLK